jgi:hypothetical protein
LNLTSISLGKGITPSLSFLFSRIPALLWEAVFEKV